MHMPLFHRRTMLVALGSGTIGSWAQSANLLWLVPQPAGNPTDALARRGDDRCLAVKPAGHGLLSHCPVLYRAESLAPRHECCP